ncbi:MAG: flagellar motor stator protein MotA [Alphaproteobacteria bacterium]|nr:flagellar motor stator protein MotA [Alphaproteobacteria bacterium]MBV8549446.1 flagellar motor stator protein MotA [Alphaproteobacteria bacterium]
MNLIIGIVTVILCTMGGYVLEGGHIQVLAKAAPLEIVIMGGTMVGGFVIANPPIVIKRTLKSLGLLMKKPRYDKGSYIELLCVLYQFFKLARTKGALALEKHIENPEESSLFEQFPGFKAEHHPLEFFCDYLRLITLGADKPFEIDALMDEELQVHHDEDNAIVTAVQNVADGLPAIGIVAAVLGVIHTMGSISEPPEVLGRLIAGALVGTFMGVWIAYGYVGPMANSLKAILENESKYMQCIKIGLLAHLQGSAPSVSIEYARKTIPSDVRPTFGEVEEATSALTAPTA